MYNGSNQCSTLVHEMPCSLAWLVEWPTCLQLHLGTRKTAETFMHRSIARAFKFHMKCIVEVVSFGMKLPRQQGSTLCLLRQVLRTSLSFSVFWESAATPYYNSILHIPTSNPVCLTQLRQAWHSTHLSPPAVHPLFQQSLTVNPTNLGFLTVCSAFLLCCSHLYRSC